MSIILLFLSCMDKGNPNPEPQVCAAAQIPDGALFVDQSNSWGLEDISADAGFAEGCVRMRPLDENSSRALED